jgi:hypothetical protein
MCCTPLEPKTVITWQIEVYSYSHRFFSEDDNSPRACLTQFCLSHTFKHITIIVHLASNMIVDLEYISGILKSRLFSYRNISHGIIQCILLFRFWSWRAPYAIKYWPMVYNRRWLFRICSDWSYIMFQSKHYCASDGGSLRWLPSWRRWHLQPWVLGHGMIRFKLTIIWSLVSPCKL